MEKPTKKKLCKEEVPETQKVKWHARHLWRKEFIDCPNCGGCEVKYCKRCYEEKVIK